MCNFNASLILNLTEDRALNAFNIFQRIFLHLFDDVHDRAILSLVLLVKVGLMLELKLFTSI